MKRLNKIIKLKKNLLNQITTVKQNSKSLILVDAKLKIPDTLLINKSK